jgi:hypothetical protein
MFPQNRKKLFREKEGVEIELGVTDTVVIQHGVRKGSEGKITILSTKVRFRNPLYAKKFLELNRKTK